MAFDCAHLPWVFGLRPHYSYENWLEAVGSIVLGRFEHIRPGPRTAEAEAGLGIRPSFYWYIARTDASFGHGVFLWQPNPPGWEQATRGACPFDTGGLWHGFIATEPPISTPEAKRSLFERHDCQLAAWLGSVTEYLSNNYRALADYVTGLPPIEGVPEITKGLPNGSRSWTWEARIPRDDLDGKIALRRLFCTAEDKERFLTWLVTAPEYDLPTKKQLTSWFGANAISCEIGESARFAAERFILSTATPATS